MMVATSNKATQAAEVFSDIAYVYDGTLEGLLTAIFCSYARHESPTDVMAEGVLQPRLAQLVTTIETDFELASRVKRGICKTCGHEAFDAVKKAALSSDPEAGTAAYRFVHYAMGSQKRRDCARCRKRATCKGAHGTGQCPRLRGRALSDITHPAVEPLFRIARAVDNECEHMRQFIRFEHLHDSEVNVWFARCNPRDNVVPLIMGHFIERFNVQPFIIYDEVHRIAGVYEGESWYLMRTDESDPSLALPKAAAEEEDMQQAWKTFYHTVAIESRYNPELRQHFMPKRFWRNLTEMQGDFPKRGRTANGANRPMAKQSPSQKTRWAPA